MKLLILLDRRQCTGFKVVHRRAKQGLLIRHVLGLELGRRIHPGHDLDMALVQDSRKWDVLLDMARLVHPVLVVRTLQSNAVQGRLVKPVVPQEPAIQAAFFWSANLLP